MIKRSLSLLAALTSSLTLAAGFSAPAPVYAQEQTNSGWAEDIPAMLSAGDYAQGEAIAGVISYGSTQNNNHILNDGEEVMDITAAADALFDEPVPDDGEVHMVYVQREDMSTEEILYTLAKDDRVLFAEPNYIFNAGNTTDEWSLTYESAANDGDAYTAQSGTTSVVTEDIADLTPFQWSSSDNSSWVLEGNSQSSIHVPGFGATGSNMTGEPVVVAVLDSAIDFTHSDLAPAAYTFTQEMQDALHCDVHGYNATSQSTDGKLKYWDKSYHGTHCAGIIGAAWDGKGISGVASNVRLVSVQNCTDDGYTSLINALRGYDFIDRANEAGCNISITSNSWGLLQSSKSIDAAVRKLGDKWGVISVFSAGNDDYDLEIIGEINNTIFDDPYTIIVASGDSDGNRSPFSSYGKNIVDLAAPGSGILSTVNVNDKAARYFADAAPSLNKFYDGFEEDTAVTVTQSDGDPDTPDKAGIITDMSHFAGSHSLKLSLDPGKAQKSFTGDTVYEVILDIGDLSKYGVTAGDLIGFMAGAKQQFFIGGLSYIDASTGKEERLYETGRGGSYSNGWVENYFTVPQEMDTGNVQILITVVSNEGLDELYIDSVGAGSAKVPYTILDGTSMACPAISGAAAVLKSSSGADGTQLASLVRSKVRQSASFAQITKTGGIFDFDVNADTDLTFTPVIQEIYLNEKELTLKGTGFSGGGTLTISRLIAGKTPEEKAVSIVSWDDREVRAALNNDFEGIMQVNLTNSGGKYDNITKFVSKGQNVYEEDLPLDNSTGEPFDFDAPGDLETEGPLIGLDDKLYYFPAATFVEESVSYKKMLRYDINTGTWQELPGIPEPLTYFSAVMYDGKIIVKGSSMDTLPDGSPAIADDPAVRIYVFDPVTNTWEQASATGVDAMDTIANNDGQLILAGGGGLSEDPETFEPVEVPATVRKYDISAGAGEVLAHLSKALFRPDVACRNSMIYIFDKLGYTIERVENGKSTVLENCLPEFFDDKDSSNPHDTVKYGVLVPVSEGIMFIGPLAADGSGDTYILKDGSDTFELYEKRMSDSKVSFHSAASYRGFIYAIGSSSFDPDHRFFRRTAIDVPEYVGDIKKTPDDEENVTPGGNNPDTPSQNDNPGTEHHKNDAVENTPSVTKPSTPTYTPKSSASHVTSVPKTGDHDPTAMWIGIAAAAAFTMICFTAYYKRQNNFFILHSHP